MYECGLTHSTAVTDPVTETGLFMSNTVWTAWWADAGVAVAATATPISALTTSRFMDLGTRHDTINF